jgi:hypothetical protein
MKHVLILCLLLTGGHFTFCQSENPHPGYRQYYRLIPGAEASEKKRVELFSDIDTTWSQWQLRGYHFGFDPKYTPMYTTVEGILSTPYMIQVRGNAEERNKKRWGFHVFEGYAKDDQSRITMLVNKHHELEKAVAEMYYYGTVYNHSEAAYNWFRIGSDVRQHSFMFSRDKAIFYGSLKLSNALTLGSIGRDNLRATPPDGDDEVGFEESAKYVNYKALKQSDDGTIFYDKDRHMVVIKIDGRWMKLRVEPLPDSVAYDFE